MNSKLANSYLKQIKKYPHESELVLSPPFEKSFEKMMKKIKLEDVKIHYNTALLYHAAILGVIILKTHPFSNKHQTTKKQLLSLDNACAFWCMNDLIIKSKRKVDDDKLKQFIEEEFQNKCSKSDNPNDVIKYAYNWLSKNTK